MRWLAFINSDVHKAFGPIFTPQRYLPDSAFAARLAEAARTRILGLLAILDKRLQGRDWLVDQRSVADPYLFVITRWAQNKNLDTGEFSNLARFAHRMNDDAGVRAALVKETR
jgi:glutathione S-transferase